MKYTYGVYLTTNHGPRIKAKLNYFNSLQPSAGKIINKCVLANYRYYMILRLNNRSFNGIVIRVWEQAMEQGKSSFPPLISYICLYGYSFGSYMLYYFTRLKGHYFVRMPTEK